MLTKRKSYFYRLVWIFASKQVGILNEYVAYTTISQKRSKSALLDYTLVIVRTALSRLRVITGCSATTPNRQEVHAQFTKNILCLERESILKQPINNLINYITLNAF